MATTAATLTIVVSPVEHVPSGQDRPTGRRRRHESRRGRSRGHGPRAIALVTFLDGSTVTVQPDSDVVIARVGGRHAREHEPAHPDSRRQSVGAGGPLLGRRSSISLESNEYAATARDGLIGAEQAPDGTFVCWTRAGEVTVAGRDGHALARLSPGQKATVGAERPGAVEPFQRARQRVEIEASPNVLPLLQVPDPRRRGLRAARGSK